MKVKKVCFGEDSRDTIKIPGFPGRHQMLYIGMLSGPSSRDNPVRCEVTALDFDQRSGSLMIHKKAADPFDPARGNPGRQWDIGQADNQKCEADYCILMCPDKTTVYGDDPQPEPTKVPVVEKNEKPAELPTANQEAKPEQDPPPAQPVQKQGQTRR